MNQKTLLTCFVFLTLVIVPAFCQIQIQSEGQTKSYSETKKEISYINWHSDGYYFYLCDYKTAKYHLFGDKFTIKIFLGKNAQEVRQSGDILQQWFDGAKNEAFINVTNPNGQKICLYKYNANLYASYGDEMNCKSTRIQYGADITAAVAGVAYTTKAERDELMASIEFGDYILSGLCSFKKEFMKSIKNFKEPGQISQKARQAISEKIGLTRKKAREAGLEESECLESYGLILRELMHSDKEKDWETINHLNCVILDLTTSKSHINQAELEERLKEQEDISGKISVFEEYYTTL